MIWIIIGVFVAVPVLALIAYGLRGIK